MEHQTDDHILFGEMPVSAFGIRLNTHTEYSIAWGQKLIFACAGQLRAKWSMFARAHWATVFIFLFGNSILVMCANTAKRKFLLLTLAVGFECCRCKNSIIPVILFHLNIFLSRHWFQTLSALYCLICICWVLAKIETFSTGVINEETSTCVTMFFSGKRMW